MRHDGSWQLANTHTHTRTDTAQTHRHTHRPLVVIIDIMLEPTIMSRHEPFRHKYIGSKKSTEQAGGLSSLVERPRCRKSAPDGVLREPCWRHRHAAPAPCPRGHSRRAVVIMSHRVEHHCVINFKEFPLWDFLIRFNVYST